MKKEIIVSKDGSHTLNIPEMNETYHSTNGALTESRHVFIDKGINKVTNNEINIFEVGFGTGLNAITTLEWLTKNSDRKVIYHSIEAFPVSPDLIEQLNYNQLFDFDKSADIYTRLHQVKWEEQIVITSQFELLKIHKKLENHSLNQDYYDCIYFDAFAPNKQGELWELKILKKCYQSLKIGGRFVTYCAKGQLKRDLKALGFSIKMEPGPPGKREMTTAIKLDELFSSEIK
jgi:tRNA U34 5-methylaminomethyl-2-thiouridine-forming methyltransferase MnmC